MKRIWGWLAVLLAVFASGERPAVRAAHESPWKRHTIDNSSRGADGVRLADFDGDGLLDIATGWEEGGVVRAYRNPGAKLVRELWPGTTVGTVTSPEDAVFGDLDGDGHPEVVSSCEGRERQIYIHWAEGKSWRTEALPAAAGRMQWMYALPLQIDGEHGIDLVGGGKNASAAVGWFEAPGDPRVLADWIWRPLAPAGWIMSLEAHDMDGDGDPDLLVSDRRGPASGAFWLENPGPGPALRVLWEPHYIGAVGKEVMFLTSSDFDGDGKMDVVSSVKPREIHLHRRRSRHGRSWQNYVVQMPDSAGTAKAVRVADVDLDGKMDLVFSCEQAEGKLSGVMWLSYRYHWAEPAWRAHDISGPEGVKFDRIELLDLDGDGDLDVITCEERENLGLVWYENPTR